MIDIAYLSFSISESNINVANNTSVVTVSLLFTGNSTSYDYDAYGQLEIGGTRFDFKKGFSKNCGTITLTTQSKTVTHESDGGGSINVWAKYVTATSVIGTTTNTIDYNLQTIPRASSFTLPSTITVGSTGAYTISSASSSFTHKISFELGGTAYYLLGSSSSASSSKSGNTAAIPTTSAFLSKITSANGVTVTATCTTYSGNTKLGTKTRNFTIKLRGTDKPTISIIGTPITDANDKTKSLECWVNGFSKPKVTFSANAPAGAKLQSYDILIGRSYAITNQSFGDTPVSSVSSKAVTCNTLNQSGTLSVTVVVRDTRGVETSQAIGTITSLQYTAPTCTLTAWRCNKDGIADGNGTSIKCKVAWTYDSLNGKNSITSNLEYKKHKNSQWSAFQDVTMPANGGTTALINAEFPISESYDVRLSVTDKLSPKKTSIFNLGVAAKTMSFKPAVYDSQNVMIKDAGVAIGKYAETNELFEVDWNSQFNKDFHVGGFSQLKGGYGSGMTSSSPHITSITEVNNGTKYLNGTGILKIILPQGYNNSMVKFDVEFYAYNSYAICKYSFGGQIYSSTNSYSWARPVCYFDGTSSISDVEGNTLSNLPVKFGKYNDKAAISLGVATTKWQNCAISIKNIQIFFANLDLAKWSSGWEIILDTSELNEIKLSKNNPTTLAADYIIGQGTSGVWTYRKWNSGIAECWSNPTANTTYSLTSSSNYGFYCNSTITIPTVVDFISKPMVTATACGATGLTTVNITSVSETKIEFRPYCTTSMSWSGKIFFNCKGRWK